MSISSLKYTIFSGFLTNDNPYSSLHNKSYVFWNQFWSEIYDGVGNLDAFHVDDFFRQHYISVVSSMGQPVGLVMNSCFELNSPITQDHSYFKYYPPEILKSLRHDNVNRIMTFEFLTISSEWRRQRIGYSLGEVMMGLSQQIFLENNADCGIAVARTDVRAIDIVKKVGFFPVLEGLKRKNFPVDVVLCTPESVKHNEDEKAQSLVQNLWSHRSEARRFNFDNASREAVKKAA